MIILLSPSEKKELTHKNEIPHIDGFYKEFLTKDIARIVENYIKCLRENSEGEISKMLGVKHIVLDELVLLQNINNTPLLQAVERYSGVAFKALGYESLNKKEKEYINGRVFIFSNLFGILRACDLIPYYDLKQGEGFACGEYTFKTKDIYANNAKNYIEELKTQSNFVLDLRAGFYQKCLKLPQDFKICELNFIKNGKSVSHYAKHYRGLLLRECARNNIQTFDSIKSLKLEGLEIINIEESGQKLSITYNLV